MSLVLDTTGVFWNLYTNTFYQIYEESKLKLTWNALQPAALSIHKSKILAFCITRKVVTAETTYLVFMRECIRINAACIQNNSIHFKYLQNLTFRNVKIPHHNLRRRASFPSRCTPYTINMSKLHLVLKFCSSSNAFPKCGCCECLLCILFQLWAISEMLQLYRSAFLHIQKCYYWIASTLTHGFVKTIKDCMYA